MKYQLKTIPKADGTYPIILRPTVNGKALVLSTGYSILESEWNVEIGEPLMTAQGKLYRILQRFHWGIEAYIQDERRNQTLTRSGVVDRWKEIIGRVTSGKRMREAIAEKKQDKFWDTFDKFAKSPMLAQNTRNNYAKTKRNLEAFRKTSKIDERYINDFLQSRLDNEKANATIKKDLQIIKRVLDKCDIQLRIDWEELTKPLKTVKTDTVIYLTKSELEALESVKKRTRSLDAWLLRAYTGIRFSEMELLDLEEVKGNTQELFIPKNKTVRKVTIPDKAKEILQRYNGKAPQVTQQVENRVIKEICKELKFTDSYTTYKTTGSNTTGTKHEKHKLISSHSARKTFAMLVYSQTKDVLFVSLQLGHSNTAVTRNYLGVTDEMKTYNLDEILK